MSTESTGSVLAARLEQLKQKRDENKNISDTVAVYQPPQPKIIVRPTAPTWEELEVGLQAVINYPNLWITVRKLYEQGYGAELLTVAEIALATHKKQTPYSLFASSISKASGNWTTRTLKMVQDTWEIRRNALEVMDKLNIEAKNAKAILALAWRLKGTIIRFLSIATEKGTGIRNPIGLFFALTKKPKPA